MSELKKINGLSLEERIEKETSLRIAKLWGEPVQYSPVLCDQIFGDGLQLVYLGTIGQRPRYWLILIDSKTDVSSDDFDFEDILQPLEECFGRPDEPDEDFEYPVIDWDGGHWGTIVNFGI